MMVYDFREQILKGHAVSVLFSLSPSFPLESLTLGKHSICAVRACEETHMAIHRKSPANGHVSEPS